MASTGSCATCRRPGKSRIWSPMPFPTTHHTYVGPPLPPAKVSDVHIQTMQSLNNHPASCSCLWAIAPPSRHSLSSAFPFNPLNLCESPPLNCLYIAPCTIILPSDIALYDRRHPVVAVFGSPCCRQHSSSTGGCYVREEPDRACERSSP